MLRRMSVTSSGRSSMSSTITWISGWLVSTAWAMRWSMIVLPVFGGATMSARWPLPSGAIRSSTRVTISLCPFSSLIRSIGSIEVRSLKWGSRGAPLQRAAVHRVHLLDQALLPAHLRLRGEVLALPQPQLLHQVLGDLRVLRARRAGCA